MLNPAWIDATAEGFWAVAGGPPPAPRDLDAAILLTLPLAIVQLPRLRPPAIDAWLVRHGVAPCFAADSGRLHACLVATEGQGIIFLEGGDPPDERRFSLAHELAHYLSDYERPRARALGTLGPTIGDVLDGRRPPTGREQVHALLGDVSLGVHLHLFTYDDPAVARQERDADRLAVELLAPAADCIPLARSCETVRREDRPSALAARLTAAFGLPAAIAVGYAARLLRHLGDEPTFAEWLGLSNFDRSGGRDG